MAGSVHRYRARCLWEGSTAGGYTAYSREHRAEVPPAEVDLVVSADTAFGGDRRRMNPEQMLVLAASSCQLLSFLACAALSRVDVVSYEDIAEGVMPEDEVPQRITAITLRPRIVVGPGTEVALVRRLVDKAHADCYVANTLACTMTLEPDIIVAGG